MSFFDATQHEPTTSSFDPLPQDRYTMQVKQIDEKTSKAGHKYLSFTLEVLEGKFKGRRLWENINLNHPQDKVRAIANQTLSAICHAVEVLRPGAAEELQGIPFIADVGLRKDKDGEMQNRIRKYISKRQAFEEQQVSTPQSQSEGLPWG